MVMIRLFYIILSRKELKSVVYSTVICCRLIGVVILLFATVVIFVLMIDISIITTI
jgi:hypothetical protein